MTHKRMDEAKINASLDAFLHGAEQGDASQARRLHEMLDKMLTERDGPDGRYWLTEHGKMVLAEIHRQLSHCEASGDHLRDEVLEAVQFKPRRHHWKDTCNFVSDLRVAIAVANVLCEQRRGDQTSGVIEAAEAVAKNGEFDLTASEIAEVYEDIAATVGGFREISHC
jgi:hypothetical protein